MYTCIHVVVIRSWEAGKHSTFILQNIGPLSQQVASASVLQTLQERNDGRPGCSGCFFTESLLLSLSIFLGAPPSIFHTSRGQHARWGVLLMEHLRRGKSPLLVPLASSTRLGRVKGNVTKVTGTHFHDFTGTISSILHCVPPRLCISRVLAITAPHYPEFGLASVFSPNSSGAEWGSQCLLGTGFLPL